jgi:hypothetical protein
MFDDFFDDDIFLEFETQDGKVNDDEDDEEYSIDDEGGKDSGEGKEAPPADDTTQKPEDTPAQSEAPPADNNEPPAGDSEAPPADDEDDEYSMDDGEDSGEEGGEDSGEEGGEDSGEGETTDDTSSSDNSSINPKLQELENVIFDSLSDAEKQLKIKELKELYISVYNKCTTITDMMTEVKRDEATIQIIEYISNTLLDLKQYVNDYINDIFDSKTYVENLSQLQKYIMVFNAVNKVLAQIKAENE